MKNYRHPYRGYRTVVRDLATAALAVFGVAVVTVLVYVVANLVNGSY